MNRYVTYLLALILAVSTAALAMHGAQHADAGLEKCLLCASHADAKAAADTNSGNVMMALFPVAGPFHPVRFMQASAPVVTGLPRAPPPVS